MKRLLPVLAAVAVVAVVAVAAVAAVVAVAASVNLVARDEPEPAAARARPQTWTGSAALLQTPNGTVTTASVRIVGTWDGTALTPTEPPALAERTFTFAKDLDRHRAAIGELYDGPVCVELVATSNQDLEALDERLRHDLEARGLQYLGGSPGGTGCGCVTADLVAATPEETAEIEHSYDDLVQLTSFLQPRRRLRRRWR